MLKLRKARLKYYTALNQWAIKNNKGTVLSWHTDKRKAYMANFILLVIDVIKVLIMISFFILLPMLILFTVLGYK